VKGKGFKGLMHFEALHSKAKKEKIFKEQVSSAFLTFPLNTSLITYLTLA
jgi:hypothetical protein